MLPLMAASRLNGNDEDPRDMKGGSTRVKGAEPRRFLVIPAFFRGGDLPAGAVRGARGDEMLARAGVRAGGGGMDWTGAKEKLNGVPQVSLLLFLDGEKRRGSVFSESVSSYTEAERLPVILAGDMEGVNGLPLRGELLARKPEFLYVSIQDGYYIGFFCSGIPFWRFLADESCWTRELLSSPKGVLAMGTVVAIGTVCVLDESQQVSTRSRRSRAVSQHLVRG